MYADENLSFLGIFGLGLLIGLVSGILILSAIVWGPGAFMYLCDMGSNLLMPPLASAVQQAP